MGSIIRNLWSSESPGPRTVVRVLDAAIATVGIICIAVGSNYPASGMIYYITLGVAVIWSTLISFLTHNDRLFHPGFLIAMDFMLAVVHYVFGIVNALSADTAGYLHTDAIRATFLLITAVIHTVFFVLACRDTHVRRRSSVAGAQKVGIEINTA
ncbi:hypothetical protein ASPVEDRAFT_78457 [Aspergillus versicolor CBS 583.65]|uniref:MARVEL domain-containing protein n=1 Tax=Aspergillus versicolor CBS 583.65 TaxID=1036611 RepID=A0A1L9P5B5_ASPVE|nr:uncharacterized protein ASPVEDRAFT_78457 [Aspergillus versicolor CBS 583.65]OJI96699.1 hypothetical protein ASPVEDRAFT_78457 [Aspergillus versicolor CBS 583.65]